MDIHVRDCVFETNSSSSHSLSISADNIFDMNFSQEALRSGVIKLSVPVDEYGDAVHFENEWHRFYTPENTLLYMVVVAAGGKITSDQSDVDVLHDLAKAGASSPSKHLRGLVEWVKSETGCRVELSFPAIPVSDPAPAPRSICIGSDQSKAVEWLFDDHDALKSLIFNSGSYVETGYDNEQAPYYISTDNRGMETYFADRIVERTDLQSWFTLTVSAGGELVYEDNQGELVARDPSRVFDFYGLVQVAGSVNYHLESCDIVLPVYVSSWPKGMEEFDEDLGILNRDRLLDLMNGFFSYAVVTAARGGNSSKVTMKPGIEPTLIEEGTSDQVARMPHDCKMFKVRVACDEATRLKVRAKAAVTLKDVAA